MRRNFMKKKLALIFIMGAVAAGASACGNKTSDDVTSESSTSEETSESEASEVEKVSDREDYVGIQDLDIDEYVTLNDYANMKVTAEKPATDDAAIESYINENLLVGNITDRAVQEGDIANIDYVGKKDGEAFDGGTAEGYDLTIGSNTFIDGFEDGLIGVMPGETVDLNLTFPENYSSSDLAGQDVVFTVTVNSIQGSAEYATVTVEDMEKMGLEYKSLEELWEAGKSDVEEEAQMTFNSNAQSAIVDKLMEECTVNNIPDYLIEEQAQNYNLYVESMAQSWYGVDLETFVSGMYGMTIDEFNEEVNDMCQEMVEQYLVMEAVARAEGIEMTEDMVNEQAAEEATQYGYESAESFLDEIGFTTYRMSLVQDKVIERLMELINVEEETEAVEASVEEETEAEEETAAVEETLTEEETVAE
jgi:trigger factor